MTNKMTNKKALEIAIATLATDPAKTEVVEKLKKMLIQAEKKAGTDRKPTARQIENEGFKKVILEWLEGQTEPKTVTDMMKEIPELDGMTNQRVSALVKQLKDTNMVDKTISKGRSYFKLVEQQ